MKLTRMFSTIRIVSISLLGLVISACSGPYHTTVGHNFNGKDRHKIVFHKTTREQILAMFGKPDDSYINHEHDEIWLYTYGKVKATMDPWQDANHETTKMKKLAMIINPKGIVVDTLYSNSLKPLHSHKHHSSGLNKSSKTTS